MFGKKKPNIENDVLADKVKEYLEAVYTEQIPAASRKQIHRVSPEVPIIVRDEEDGIKYSLRDPPEADSYDEIKMTNILTRFMQSNDSAAATLEMKNHMDRTFVEWVSYYIRTKNIKDSQVYKAAQMDRRLYSKMMGDRYYKPAKDTAIAVVLALKLSINDAKNLLSRAGYTLSHSCKRDIIIECFIKEEIYDIAALNDVLYRFEQKTLGR